MPVHQAIIQTDVPLAILPGFISWALAVSACLFLGLMKGTTPRKRIQLWIFLLLENLLWFWAMFPVFAFILLMTYWNSRFDPSSVLMSDWVTRLTQPLSTSAAKPSLLKASLLRIYSPNVYFISKSNPISAIAHLVILADAVLGIASSLAKRCLRGLW